MFPESFPFYKLELDLPAHINPLVIYTLVLVKIKKKGKLLSVLHFGLLTLK